jgi:hypothetical protein
MSVGSGYASTEIEINYVQDEEGESTEFATVTAPDSDAEWVWHDTNVGYTFFRETWSPKTF